MNMTLDMNKIMQNILDDEIVDSESLKYFLSVFNKEKTVSRPKTLKKTFTKANSVKR